MKKEEYEEIEANQKEMRRTEKSQPFMEERG